MIHCSDVAVRLMDYAMGDLEEGAQQQIDQHLTACTDCSKLVDDYRAVSDLVHDAMVVELSDEDQAALDASVLDAIARSA